VIMPWQNAEGIVAELWDAAYPEFIMWLLGTLIVIWQIGRQFTHAIEQNRDSERQKLKLEIYRDISSVCRQVSHAETDLSAFVRNFEMQIAINRELGAQGSLPSARVPALMALKAALDTASTEPLFLLERWEIIDPRTKVYRLAFDGATYGIIRAYNAYFNHAIRQMPVEVKDGPDKGNFFPWSAPNEDAHRVLTQLGEYLIDELSKLGCVVADLQRDMQNLLLVDLFQNRVEARQPIDPKYVVIELDRHEELTTFMLTQTEWGRKHTQTERELRKQQAAKLRGG
jgi:hypothetical protein